MYKQHTHFYQFKISVLLSFYKHIVSRRRNHRHSTLNYLLSNIIKKKLSLQKHMNFFLS